ncbi:MAG: DUF1566 domain-containing protein [Alphaproteobacteria bacterium]|nr:DUF1566 domain-containing protein [Alphaproteobacteria bacterium]OJV47530.1 MAG: hypothetical protein BGO28_06750 [Alphaproteobacteria bacterium 43-37]
MTYSNSSALNINDMVFLKSLDKGLSLGLALCLLQVPGSVLARSQTSQDLLNIPPEYRYPSLVCGHVVPSYTNQTMSELNDHFKQCLKTSCYDPSTSSSSLFANNALKMLSNVTAANARSHVLAQHNTTAFTLFCAFFAQGSSHSLKHVTCTYHPAAHMTYGTADACFAQKAPQAYVLGPNTATLNLEIREGALNMFDEAQAAYASRGPRFLRNTRAQNVKIYGNQTQFAGLFEGSEKDTLLQNLDCSCSTHSKSKSVSWSETLSQTRTPSLQSKTPSITRSPTLSHTKTATLKPPPPPTPAPAVFQAWDLEAYKDSTNQNGRYVENTPGVVTDTLTTIEWEKAVNSVKLNWASAQTYCQNLQLGGFSDWVMPTPSQLQSLMDYTLSMVSGGAPLINTAAFPNTPVYWFWTVNSVTGSVAYTWVVEFTWGNRGATSGVQQVLAQLETSTGYVRCMRQKKNYSGTRFKDENEGTLTSTSEQVKDMTTGLIWQRLTPTTGQNWNGNTALASAQSYCSTLSLGANGPGSWRHSTIKELLTLADFNMVPPSQFAPRLDQTVFQNIKGSYCSSTLINDGASENKVWAVRPASTTSIVYGNALTNCYAICVR